MFLDDLLGPDGPTLIERAFNETPLMKQYCETYDNESSGDPTSRKEVIPMAKMIDACCARARPSQDLTRSQLPPRGEVSLFVDGKNTPRSPVSELARRTGRRRT